ncbi:putative type I phosphodiesterase/nucleotide pyrophosphatase [Sodalis praecaptivus]|uniref:Putative type I phosphodiesterase/nucleotide pyrophosphatase n=1 Tax=Sodalis praecaptivus TaxID=1239307 RepID=W0HXQ6_9GAMM|nr:alkaline phosphatase family protein [Sodalis praecaptivus]AHF77307.1 putative type I phosphodiesterase/nucleotide pyrophosphatase [Sodalis praecaptivus]
MRKVIVFGVDGLSMPLLKRYAAQGALPNIARMLQQGAATELLPFISAWGDVNWVAFMAGQGLGTAWRGQALPADNHQTGNLLDQMTRQGLKAALVHFPETVVADAGHFSFAPYWGRSAPWAAEHFKPMGHTTRYQARTGDKHIKQQKLGWPPNGTLAYHDKGAWQPLEKGADGGYALTLQGQRGNTLTLPLGEQEGKPVIWIGDQAVALAEGEWSPWCSLRALNVSGSVRFYLGCYRPERDEVEILQAQVTDPDQLCGASEQARALLAHAGPFFSKWVVKASPQEDYPQATYQEGDEQSLWLADTALTLTQQQGYALWATVHRLVDESHHNCLGQCDPASPFFDPAQAARYDAVMRDCYQILDKTMGKLMAQMDDETVLMLASDHGAVPNAYMCDIYRYLAKHQLVVLDEQLKPDMARSQVYLKDERGGLEIFVNLAGREATGIVSPADYDAVCAKTLHALGSWHVLEQGQLRNAVSLALLKDDAAGIGFWGPCAGDIVFAYNAGFVWGVSRGGEDICPVEVPGANHGPQKPTAATAMSSNYGALVMMGAGVRAGYYHDRATLGPYTMVDPAATIAHLLGLPLATLDGRVMHSLLADGHTHP